MKLSSQVLSVVRRGALGGALALGGACALLGACTSQSGAIQREPAAQLAPTGPLVPAATTRAVVAPLPVVAPPSIAAPPSVTPDAGTATVVAEVTDAGTRHRHHRRGTAPGSGDPNVGVLGTLGYTGSVHFNGGAGCGRG